MEAEPLLRSPDAGRLLAVPGTGNLRDLGGYDAGDGVTRWNALMRADALTDLGTDGRRALAALGVRTVVDLREPVERELDPDAISGLELRVYEQPLFAGRVDLNTVRGLRGLYATALASCGDRFAAVVGVLCEPGALPAIVHCSAGKDRTGLVAALVLSALGVPDVTVAADYALTASYLQGEFLAKVHARAVQAGLTEQALAVALDSPAELMLETLELLRAEYGGAGAYLEHHGLEAGRLELLRSALVTAPFH
jgi:protein-tyrosine phosphatase